MRDSPKLIGVVEIGYGKNSIEIESVTIRACTYCTVNAKYEFAVGKNGLDKFGLLSICQDVVGIWLSILGFNYQERHPNVFGILCVVLLQLDLNDRLPAVLNCRPAIWDGNIKQWFEKDNILFEAPDLQCGLSAIPNVNVLVGNGNFLVKTV